MRHRLSLVVLCSVIISCPAFSQAPTPAPPAAEEPKEGFRAEYLGDLKGLEDKILKLVKATPQEKITWRPSPDVRNFSEVFLHIATTNYTFPRMVGVVVPARVDLRGMQSSTTEKSKIAEAVRASFAHARQGVLGMADADMDKTAQGSTWTRRRAPIYQLRHASEHMGQLIAYTRVNGITPPWTEEAQQRQRQQPAKQN